MSPLTGKLAAILDEWDHLSALLADIQQQCTAKDGTIVSLQQTIANQQQQITRQSADLAALKSQLAALQAQATSALLTAADPDDARLKKRIDAAYQAMASQKPLPIASMPPGSGSGMSHMAGNGSNGNGSGAPVRPATPNDSQYAPSPERAPSPVKSSPANNTVRLTPIPGPAKVTVPNTQAKPQPQPVSISLAR